MSLFLQGNLQSSEITDNTHNPFCLINLRSFQAHCTVSFIVNSVLTKSANAYNLKQNRVSVRLAQNLLLTNFKRKMPTDGGRKIIGVHGPVS